MMLKRSFSALLIVGVWLGLCFAGLFPFTLGVTALTALGLHEFVAAYRQKGVSGVGYRVSGKGNASSPGDGINPAVAWCGVALPLFAYLVCRYFPALRVGYALILAAFVAGFALLVGRAARVQYVLGKQRALYGLFGMVYVGALFSSFVLLRGLPGKIRVAPFGLEDKGAWWMLCVAVCVWATDTFAYLVGRGIGRHKLAPTLSPGKTIEGALGGLLAAIAAGVVFGLWIQLPLLYGVLVGVTAGLVGQVGDLFESALKREIGIKDFGNLLPGHGGTLDRFDSLLFVAPLAYLALSILAGV